MSYGALAQNNTSVKKLNKKWLKQVNKGDSSIVLLYKFEAPILFNGRLTNATDTVTAPFDQLKVYANKVKKVETIAEAQHVKGHAIQMQQCIPNLSDKPNAIKLTAWEFREKEYHKAFEIIDTTNVDSSMVFYHIDTFRSQWQTLANKGSYKELVKKLYSEDAIYYYRDSTFITNNDLSRQFNYMKGNDWFARINPTSTIALNNSTVVEFGNYYSRKRKTLYIFVWQRVKNTNEWLIVQNFEF